MSPQTLNIELNINSCERARREALLIRKINLLIKCNKYKSLIKNNNNK